ncbi:MAG: hypothetical protein D6746_04590 [Bacteroidetes bacterium]|nr:MAG: hypothetical protein D6746_04590 [Bacteroidota bacterium]
MRIEINHRDLVKLETVLHKTVATFIEAFFATWVITDTSTVKTALVAALAAAIVPVKNAVVEALTEDLDPGDA